MRKQTKIAAMVSAAALLTMGAAMTSFAAGWAKEGEDFVYLDRYGDRVVNEWKKDGNYWFYLGDDGYMVTSQLLTDTGSTNDIYYVDSSGRKVTNAWISLDNTDGFVLPSGDEPSTVYYYFGSDGKAVKSGSGDEYKAKKVKKSNDSTEQAYFLFDEQGHMMSGWVHNGEITGEEDLYYLGAEDEGWAYTGWHHLEAEEHVELDPYETEHDYWFSDTGKCAKADTTRYIDGQYYYFTDPGRYCASDWFTFTSAPDSDPNALKTGLTTDTDRLATGWRLQTDDEFDDGGEHWYYLINVRDENGKVRATVPFNRNGAGKAEDDGNFYAARSIGNKIYLFNGYGQMYAGVVNAAVEPSDFEGAFVYNSNGNVMQDPNVSGVGSEDGDNRYKLSPDKIYYFNNVGGSSEGQMAKNSRVTVNIDGETYYYYFGKDGAAYTDAIVSGVLYGHDGKRVQSDAGWMAYPLPNTVKYTSGGVTYDVTGVVAVNSSGRVRTTNSTVRIDGENFDVKFAPTTEGSTEIVASVDYKR